MVESSFHFSEKDGECLLTIQCPTGDLSRLMDLVRDKLLTPILEERQCIPVLEPETLESSTVDDDMALTTATDDTYGWVM
jgi:hypothetical protein